MMEHLSHKYKCWKSQDITCSQPSPSGLKTSAKSTPGPADKFNFLKYPIRKMQFPLQHFILALDVSNVNGFMTLWMTSYVAQEHTTAISISSLPISIKAPIDLEFRLHNNKLPTFIVRGLQVSLKANYWGLGCGTSTSGPLAPTTTISEKCSSQLKGKPKYKLQKSSRGPFLS